MAHRRFLPDVGGDRKHLVGALRAYGIQRRAATAGDDHAPSRTPESERHRAPYSAAATGYDRDAAHGPARRRDRRCIPNASATAMKGSSTPSSPLRTIRAPDSSAPNR